MFIAPAAAGGPRRGPLARSLQFLGLSALGIFLFLVACGGYFAYQFLHSTPEGLYHRVWQVTPQLIYDPATLKDWDDWRDKFAGQISSDQEAVARANEMLSSSGDPFTRLHSRDDVSRMKQSQSGKFAGIGIAISAEPESDPTKQSYPVIQKVFAGGPAASVGLQAGDALVEADGKSLAGKPLDEIVGLVQGKEGTVLEVTYERDGKRAKALITRAIISVASVETKRFGDTGYIRLENFEQTDARDSFEQALRDMSDTGSLIIDLRGNPGGRVDYCIDIASMFLDTGDLVTIRHRIPFSGHMSTTYRVGAGALQVEEVVQSLDASKTTMSVDSQARKPNLTGSKPVVVLVDGHSASASEMLTGALKDNGRAIIVGEKTFGKGVGQTLLPFVNGTMLRVTTLRYYTPSGLWVGDGSAEHHGIEPDHEVKAQPGLKFGESSDNQLQYALELLR